MSLSAVDGVRTLLDAVAAATAVGGFDGCLGLLLLHSEALFAGGEDGVLRRLQAGRDGVAVTASRDFAAPITSLNFEPGFSRLAVGTAHVSRKRDAAADVVDVDVSLT